MNFHPMSYQLYGDKFTTPEMQAIFAEQNYLQKILDVEMALAEAESELGLIPVSVVPLLKEQAKAQKIDLPKVKEVQKRVGHYLVSILKVWEENCPGESGQFIHYGATTQDIIDTAMVMLIREALALVQSDLNAILKATLHLAEEYKNVPMAGRTHGVHAVPITFGFKVSIWAAEIARHMQRLREIQPRVLIGNLTGAVGTFAGFGEKGMEVQERALAKLGLGIPLICWHAARDHFAELINWIAMVGSTLAKIANEIRVMMKPEFGEVEEPIKEGTVGSSTMPHKRNPNLSEEIIALGKILRSYAGVMLEAMETEHERDIGTWRCEFLIIPESFLVLSAALRNAKNVLAGLKVNSVRMRQNLNLTKGLIMSETFMFALGEKIGKQKAHELVYELSMKAVKEGKPFGEVIKENEALKRYFRPEQLAEMLDPARHTGLAEKVVERVLGVLRNSE
ncbi:MAG: adenylosuccinate lyase [Thermodesulfobacteriota bacterium]